METSSHIVFKLGKEDRPIVVLHRDNISLHEAAFSGEASAYGRGYSLHFLAEHLPILEELVEAVRKLANDRTQHLEAYSAQNEKYAKST